ncbi:MAG: lysophospholipid acyltransferase family protein [Promethearchaeota archaeon]
MNLIKKILCAIIDFFSCFRLNKLILWIFGITMFLFFKIKNNLKIVGIKNIPRNKNFIIVGNHSSVADAYLLLAGLVGRLMLPFYYITRIDKTFDDPLMSRMLKISGAIPRRGSGAQLVNKMVAVLLDPKKRRVAIPPEGMYNKDGRIMKGFTGVVRVYHKANQVYKIPILPIVSIGAAEAYPTTPDPDGKFRPRRKKGIIGRIGKPFHLEPPKNGAFTREFLRKQTDHVMEIIRHLALQDEPLEDNWKLEQLQKNQGKKRIY